MGICRTSLSRKWLEAPLEPKPSVQIGSVLESYVVNKTIPSLFRLFGEPFSYSVVGKGKTRFSGFDPHIHDPDKMKIMSASYVKCQGDVLFGVLWYVLEEELRPLAKRMLGMPHVEETDKLAISSISEIGNILTASISNALSDDAGYRIWSSVPGFAVESLDAMLEGILADFGRGPEDVVVSSMEFQGSDSEIKLRMLLVQNLGDF